MYLAYALILTILCLILIFLWEEEKKFRKNITYGLASKYWVLRERRRFVRFNKEITINYTSRHDNSSPHDSKTLNLSRKGLCLLTYEKFKQKYMLDLELTIPDFSKPVRLTGQVMWTRDLKSPDDKGRRLFYTGIRFIKIDPESEAILLTHLNTLKIG